MRIGFFIFFISFVLTAQESNQSPHCGFDFNSYLVVETFINHQKTTLPSLKITVVDADNNEIINTNNQYSLVKTDKVLLFSENYKINNDKWFFPYAQESYLLLISLDFPSNELNIKIEDTSGIYKTQIFPIGFQNFYKLCSSENAMESRKFGPKTNIPIRVNLIK